MAKDKKPRAAKRQLTEDQILRDIKTKPLVNIWPHYAYAYDCCRGVAYKVAKEKLKAKDDAFVRVGKLIKAKTAPIRRELGIEA
jgi:hypothetical protein